MKNVIYYYLYKYYAWKAEKEFRKSRNHEINGYEFDHKANTFLKKICGFEETEEPVSPINDEVIDQALDILAKREDRVSAANEMCRLYRPQSSGWTDDEFDDIILGKNNE